MNSMFARTTLTLAPLVAITATATSARADVIEEPIAMAVLVQKDVAPRMARAVTTRVTASERVTTRDSDALRASLTAAGREAMERATLPWRAAQERLIGGLGADEWTRLETLLRDVVDVAGHD